MLFSRRVICRIFTENFLVIGDFSLHATSKLSHRSRTVAVSVGLLRKISVISAVCLLPNFVVMSLTSDNFLHSDGASLRRRTVTTLSDKIDIGPRSIIPWTLLLDEL